MSHWVCAGALASTSDDARVWISHFGICGFYERLDLRGGFGRARLTTQGFGFRILGVVASMSHWIYLGGIGRARGTAQGFGFLMLGFVASMSDWICAGAWGQRERRRKGLGFRVWDRCFYARLELRGASGEHE